MRPLTSLATALLFLPLSNLGGVQAFAESAEAELAAKAALSGFMNAWNSGNNEAVRATLNFPHITLAGSRMIVAHEPSEFTTDFERMKEREGWVRSSFDSITVTSSAPGKVHCDVVYSRYGEDGTAYRTASVFYVMTEKDGHWGMQFRGPGGLSTGELTDDQRQAEAAARKTVLDFFTAFNGSDNEALIKTLNLPHVFLTNNGNIIEALDASGPGAVMNFEAMRQREDWHMSSIDSLSPIKVSNSMVLYELVFSRFHPNGLKYRTVPALWAITKTGDHWGVQFRSLMPPTFAD